MKTKNPLILIIRDGWGYSRKKKNNFIRLAKTPNEDHYLKKYSHGLLRASGEAVGLAPNFQGNSEVGHLTIGAGRIILQTLPQIDQAIKDGSFFKNKNLLKAIKHCQKNKKHLHLLGLLQTQGVHAHLQHLLALLELCQKNNFSDILIHIITDGRDAPVRESLKHLRILERKIKELGLLKAKIVTVSGRYYALDRDKRWSRTEKAYNCIALGEGLNFSRASDYIKKSHQESVFDEFILPGKLNSYSGFSSGDALIFFNFRTDRPRQLTQAFIEKNFPHFKRKYLPLNFTAMTEYYNFSSPSANFVFSRGDLKNLLGEYISEAGLRQLRISETEKYAHVTFFFNGQKEKANKNEDRILVPSPRVATYDLKPEMSALQIAKRLKEEIAKKKYDLIIVNLVNCDMVGHTAKAKAIKKAVEAVDQAQGEIVNQALKFDYSCLLLADHGNAEDKNEKTMTSHTTNPVPVIFIPKNNSEEHFRKAKIRRGAGLADVAPTIIKILGLKKPKEMTGKSFLS